MNYHIYENAEQIGKAAAAVFAAQVLKKSDSVLGFATGSTPIPTYRQMASLYKEGAVDFSKVTTYNLDEYCDLPITHPESYHNFMMRNLFDHINVSKENIHLPDGMADYTDELGRAYDAAIDADGGVDLQILGIGVNGHIGFNEPCDCFPKYTHKVALTESTIEANKRFFDSADDVPRHAISMGIGTIMKARSIILIATGSGKAEAVKKMIKEDPSPWCPASILQFHQNVTVFLDKEAAALL